MNIKVGIFIPLQKIKKVKGRLYLIPSPLGETEIFDVIPQGTVDTISKIEHFVVEELRTARRYLSKAGFKGKIDSLNLMVLNEHTSDSEVAEFAVLLERGKDIGVISEAGLPAVADPGSKLVSMAHQIGAEVVPLVGPSSLMLALMASGKNGQNFTFNGYLPVKPHERRVKIKELERLSVNKQITQIVIETPYRNDSLLADFLQICNPETKITVAANLTMPNAFIKTKNVEEWKKSLPQLNKIPCVFII